MYSPSCPIGNSVGLCFQEIFEAILFRIKHSALCSLSHRILVSSLTWDYLLCWKESAQQQTLALGKLNPHTHHLSPTCSQSRRHLGRESFSIFKFMQPLLSHKLFIYLLNLSGGITCWPRSLCTSHNFIFGSYTMSSPQHEHGCS